MSFAAHQPRRRFGQHWLVDQSVLERIVAAAELTPDDHVLEVGPGRGALTARLLASPAAAITAVELDRDLTGGLLQRFGGDRRFRLLEGDVLAVPLPPATKVVANIPYNITGPLLERLVGRLDRPVAAPYRRLVLLVQREVGERICGLPGSGAYAALSVRLQLLGRCRALFTVAPSCFRPPPRVQSQVIRIDPLPAAERLDPALARGVEQLLRRCFASRRKMLRNSLAPLAPASALERLARSAGVELAQRPQELPPAAWVSLAAGLNQAAGHHR
jgi:16S rRNA (adenine1518-N6/adenine1519-N6)-dimethyltransferase